MTPQERAILTDLKNQIDNTIDELTGQINRLQAKKDVYQGQKQAINTALAEIPV